MRKITIIGTKGDQPRHLRNKLGCAANLVFIETDKLHRTSVPRSSDYVVLWSKFLPHKHRETIFSVIEPRRVLEFFGGLDELAERIRTLLFGKKA